MRKFEDAFIQCLKDGVYPGPSNINERKKPDGKRFNRLNGRETRRRLEMMYDFGVPYQRGQIEYVFSLSDNGSLNEGETSSKGKIPDPWGDSARDCWIVPDAGWRKHEIIPVDQKWELKRK